MKTRWFHWLSILLLFLLTASLAAQTGVSQFGISYQAVARDAQGAELVNQNISVRFTISDDEQAVTWVETHAVTTDNFGLFNLVIGEGSRDNLSTLQNFSDIPWGEKHFTLKVDIDTKDGSGFRSIGEMPFLSVPYALYAANAGTAANGGKDQQQLSYDSVAHILSLQNGGSVNLSGIVNGDISKALITKIELKDNVLTLTQGDQLESVNLAALAQSLSFNEATNTLSLSNSTATVDLSKYSQSIGLNGNNLSLSNGGGSVSLPVNRQHISLNGNSLSLSSDTSVDLSKYQDQIVFDPNLHHYYLQDINGNVKGVPVDLGPYIQDLYLSSNVLKITNNPSASSINLAPYVQDLSLNSNILKITNNPSPTPIDLSSYLQDLYLQNDSLLILSKDPTPDPINLHAWDKQRLSVNTTNNTLTIENGNTVNIDTDPTNEIQDLSFNSSNNTLKITRNASATTVDLSKYLDNTDNQQLSLSNGQLSLTNGGSVNIRETLIAFRALNNSNKNIVLALNDSVDFVFPTEKLDMANNYDKSTGHFVVPANGAGLYEFNVAYQYGSLTSEVLKVVVNGNVAETLQRFSPYSFILYLNGNDNVNLRVVNTGGNMIFNGIGSFIGYRINQ